MFFFWNNDEASFSSSDFYFFDQFFYFILFYAILFYWFCFVIFFSSVGKKFNYIINLKKWSLFFSFLLWLLTFISYIIQVFFSYDIFFLTFEISWFSFYNISYVVNIDYISNFFIFLTTFIIPICILSLWDQVNIFLPFFLVVLIFLEFLLVGVFSVSDLLLFYIYFESILIPMYLLLGIWGSRYRKIHAANLLFLYTFAGSIFFLLASIFLLNLFSNLNWFFLLKITSFLPDLFQFFLWICFFISFAIKIPMFPFHIWLPEAHVEAPTIGSVILAAILLKLGTYGMLKFLLPFYILANFFFQPFILMLSLIGVIYASFATLRQIDIKKIIAYSSISHMNLVILGLFSFNIIALSGACLMMISHGIISSALFLSIGILYDRYHTKIIKYFGGLVFYMPFFAIFFLLFSFSNISFPLTFGFVGELLIFIGLFFSSSSISFFAGFGVILGAIYSIWLYNRVFYGKESKKIFYFSDVCRREFFLLFYFSFLILFFGIFPSYFLEYFEINLLFYNIYIL